ncbi:MAG: SDR family oxidoreductase [Thermocrispum sp.]
MARFLVTGGTGNLGGQLVRRLAGSGHDVRVLTRSPRSDGPGEQVRGDLTTGAGLPAAVAGVDTIVHCATHARFAKVETLGAQRLLELAQERGIGHFGYVSIVGIDDNPFPYYQNKLRTERLIAGSGVPYTVLRATQFHDLVLTIVGGLAKMPVAAPVPRGIAFQSIDVREVAGRLAELAEGKPAGRARDIGGPRVDALADLVQVYCAATGKSRSVLPLGVPGKVGRAFRAGMNLLGPDGEQLGGTFDEFLAERFAS